MWIKVLALNPHWAPSYLTIRRFLSKQHFYIINRDVIYLVQELLPICLAGGPSLNKKLFCTESWRNWFCGRVWRMWKQLEFLPDNKFDDMTESECECGLFWWKTELFFLGCLSVLFAFKWWWSWVWQTPSFISNCCRLEINRCHSTRSKFHLR